MIRIPKNIIVESKYTQGNEYMFVSTYKKYQGYFYELNGKIFAGKEFDVYAPELMIISSNKTNSLLTKVSTYVFGKLANKTIQDLQSIIPKSLPIINSNESFYDPETPLFFYRKINQTPIKINRTDEETYKSLQNNTIYQTTFVGNYQEVTQNPEIAEQQMPGLKAFLGV